MKTLNTIILGLAASRGRHVTTSARIGAMIFSLVCGLGLLIAGLITWNGFLVYLGGILTTLSVIALVILIIINIRRNRPRW